MTTAAKASLLLTRKARPCGLHDTIASYFFSCMLLFNISCSLKGNRLTIALRVCSLFGAATQGVDSKLGGGHAEQLFVILGGTVVDEVETMKFQNLEETNGLISV